MEHTDIADLAAEGAALDTVDASADDIEQTLRTLVNENPNPPLRLVGDDVFAPMLLSMAVTLAKLDKRISGVERDLYVETATGDALDALGKVVGVRRQVDEGDERFRTRVRAGYGRATSETTIEQFAVILRIVLQCGPDDITIQGADEQPVAEVFVDQSIVANTFFSREEIERVLDGTVPAGHNWRIITQGTFEFAGKDYNPPDETGFGYIDKDGETVEGGTLGTQL